jgi:lipopolysaccharide/colanic/teichoic acid biosynthesis glycosyltransferase
MNSQNPREVIVKNLFTDTSSQPIPPWKRTIDLVCCLLALPFLCLLTVAMAIYMRFVSRGPVFFKQERVGYKGSRFMCFKFRTMTVGADTKSHQAYLDNLLGSRAPIPMVKLDMKGDSRVIPLGWILRSTGLDELPQVINILRGEMSVVGPRPCLEYEYEKYEPAQKRRFDSVPGLTGLWQVSGKNRTTFDQMIELDIRYSKVSSFGLDLWIILKTVPALIIQFADTRLARKAKVPAVRKQIALPTHLSAVKRSPQTATF